MGKLGYWSSRLITLGKISSRVAFLRFMISKQPHHSVMNLFRLAQQQLKREGKSRKTEAKCLINVAKKRKRQCT